MRLILRMSRHMVLFLALLVAAPSGARAEGGLDLYVGSTRNRTADVRISERTASGTTYDAGAIDLSSSTEFGARLEGWLPAHGWIGLAMDLGYFQADGPGVDINAIPLSFSLALRAPLYATLDRIEGRLQPYAMAGVTFYMIDISVQRAGMSASSFKSSWPLPGGSGDMVLGPYLAAGLAWQPAGSFAIFGEYRYSNFDVGYDTTNSIILPTMNGRVDASASADHLLFGISYRFAERNSGDQARQ